MHRHAKGPRDGDPKPSQNLPALVDRGGASSKTKSPKIQRANGDAAFLTESAERIRALGRRVISDVIEIGRLLTECKARCGHGNWLPWLEREFGWSDDTALNFIRCHELAKSRNFRDLSLPVTSLYLLAKPSTAESARDEVFARAESGDRLKHADVQAIIAEHGEQAVLAAASEVRARKRDEYREHAKAAASLAPSGPVGGTVNDLIKLAESGRRFGAILADAPWFYATWSHIGLAGDRMQAHRAERSREPPYRQMSQEEICALPVEALAAKDCALFFWVVQHELPQAMEVIRCWGFELKSVAFGWFKGEEQEEIENIQVPIGCGLWTRSGFEQCWIATRGNPRRLYADVRQVIIEPRREHSRKPDCVHDRIERLVAGPYLELFARRPRSGWTTWGDEIPPPDSGETWDAMWARPFDYTKLDGGGP
jgi:N6-adenosine-specific RNA methylase IME4